MFEDQRVVNMDLISQLHDALLLKILSSAPTEDAVRATILSKRYMSLWTMIWGLDYDDRRQRRHASEYETFTNFVYRTLRRIDVPSLESFRLAVGPNCALVHIERWVKIAVHRKVREVELNIYSYYHNGPIGLPSELCACGTLQTLKLCNEIFVDVPSSVCFKSLKTLHLVSVRYSDKKGVRRLLSSCPILEDLLVARHPNDNVTTFPVTVPSLQRLSIRNTCEEECYYFVIKTPSLKYLNVSDRRYVDLRVIGRMRELVKANVEVHRVDAKKFLRSIRSAKHLTLCLSSIKYNFLYSGIFHRLVRVEICTNHTTWWALFERVLKDSPILRAVTLFKPEVHSGDNYDWLFDVWDIPLSVPQCLSSHLETFEWKGYGASLGDEDVARYVLENAVGLRKASFSTIPTTVEEKSKMLKNLALVSRGSSACQLVLN